LRLEAQSRRESLRTNENGCPWGTDGFLLRFPVFGGIGLPGKAAFASMTPIKVFQPKWHILSIAEANWIERGGAIPTAI
jgi:hypothetical protein